MKQLVKLTEYAKNNQITLDECGQKQFRILCSLLIGKNKLLNLTAITDPMEIEVKHFIDSLTAAPVIRRLWSEALFGQTDAIRTEDASFRLVDVGTGAGFPGLPLKIVFPNADFFLLDSLAKRIAFVDQAVKALELKKIETEAGRAEDVAGKGTVSRETFDFCVTRAVANTAVLAEYCLPFVRINGYCILYKSGNYEEELKAAENAVSVLGGKVVDVLESTLFDTDASRSLIVIRKIKATPDQYPRRPGKPSKSPIR